MKHAHFILMFVLVTMITPAGLSGQDTVANRPLKEIGLKLHQGFVLVHSRELRPIEDSYPTGLELNLAWHKTSEKAWRACHCYPKLGISVAFWNYDNKEVLGYGLISMFYIEPVFGASRKTSFSIRAGMGLSYQNKPHDAITNPDNFSYSTQIAFPLQIGGSLHIRLQPQWYLDVTAAYNHFSNGGIRQPNKGINWPTAALGIGHYLERPEFKIRTKEDWRAETKPETRFDLIFFMAINEAQSNTHVASPGIEIKYSKQFGRINAYTIGAEWIYDNKARYAIEQSDGTENPQKGSLAIGHEFLLGKFLFSQQIGYYIYKPYAPGDEVYQRYGLVFRAFNRLSAGINLKAHRHVADFLDLRVGWIL
ncbi:MAG: acyloxyacyl hydrolase [Bacteroidia bacterium]|nr:acyloxyacyl hydrolase [Bacteroidia bacterium]